MVDFNIPLVLFIHSGNVSSSLRFFFMFIPSSGINILKNSQYKCTYKVFILFDFLSRQGEEWAKLRKPTQELMLRPAAVSVYVGTISKVADDFVGKYENGGVVDDFKHEITKYVTESECASSILLQQIISYVSFSL